MEYWEYMDGTCRDDYIEGDRVIHRTYENVKLSEFEKRVIIDNKCDAFLDMKCITEGDKADIFYSARGFVQLKSYVYERSMDAEEIFVLIMGVLKSVKKCEEYLMTGEELCISESSIYINSRTEDIRLMYIPGYRNDEDSGTQIEKLAEFICNHCSCSSMTLQSVNGYRKNIMADEYSIDKIIWITEDFIRKEKLLSSASASADLQLKAASGNSVMENGCEYRTLNGIRGKLKNIINELVS